MKKTVLIPSVLILIVLMSVSSCKKSDNNDSSSGDETTLQTTVTANSADQTSVQNDNDVFSGDVARATDFQSSFTAVPGYDSIVNDVSTIERTSLTASARRFRIRYNNRPFNGITRSGKITVELLNGANWGDAGAMIKQTFDTVKITYSNGKTRTYNGVRYVTNLNGGYWYSGTPDSVAHRIRFYGSVMYDNGATKNFWIARLNSYVKSTKTFYSDGDSTISGNKYSQGGVSRFGSDYLVQAPQTYKADSTCGFSKPYSGKRIYVADNRDVTITFGVDASGNQVAVGNCAFGYKIEWVRFNKLKGTAVIAY